MTARTGITKSAQDFISQQPDTPAGRIMAGLLAHCDSLRVRCEQHRAAVERMAHGHELMRHAFVARGGEFDVYGNPIS